MTTRTWGTASTVPGSAPDRRPDANDPDAQSATNTLEAAEQLREYAKTQPSSFPGAPSRQRQDHTELLVTGGERLRLQLCRSIHNGGSRAPRSLP